MAERSGSPRPWLVLVTGEPGSGKTTLGRAVAGALRLPFLSRDEVRGGMLATAGLWTGDMREPPAREAAVDAFVALVERAAALGVSAVVELVVTPDRAGAFDRLLAAADCLVVLTTAVDAPARARRRDLADPLLGRGEVLDALGHRSIDDLLHTPERERVGREVQTAFDLPLLEVRTDDGDDPPLDHVIDWIVQHTAR